MTARYGGEEFTCLLTDMSPEEARNVAERISHNVVELGLPNIAATPPHLTVSIGVATVMAGVPGVQAILSAADAQLYRAKQSGRNKVCATVMEGRA